MTSSYTVNQGIEKPAAGDQSGTWGGTVNTNMDIIDRVVSGVGALTLTGSTTTLTTTDGTLTDGMYRVLVLGDGGDLGSNNTITISPNDQDKLYLVYNNLTANRSAIFTQGSGDNATVENGETAWIYADGAGSGAAVRVGMSSTEIADQDGDTKIQVEEGGDDDDTIRFDLAGAEDFTITANSLNVLTGSVVALPDAAVGTPSLTNTGDLNTGLYFPAADTVGVVTGGTEQFRFGSNPIPGANKNLLINGAMRVSQRGTSFTSFGATDSEYGVDRWKIRSISSASARWTASHESSGGDSGKDKYLKLLCTTADASPGANETQWITQTIEGFNSTSVVADNASTKAISVSLDIIGHADGSSSISFPAKAAVFIDMSAGASREYVHDVTIAAADTWERVTFSAPVDSFNDWTTDNAANLGIGISLYGGSGRVGAEDTYRASGRDNITSNTDNWADATNNYIGFTNVQLEVGSVATDFAYEDIGTSLQKCFRYYARWEGASKWGLSGVCRSASTGILGGFDFPTEMRAEPTISYTTVNVVDGSAGGVDGTLSTGGVTTKSATCSLGSSSGLTDGNGLFVELKASGVIAASAEL